MPVVEHYEKQGKLAKISAVPPPDEVSISQSLPRLSPYHIHCFEGVFPVTSSPGQNARLHPESADIGSAGLNVQVFEDVERALERVNASGGSKEESKARVSDYVGAHAQGAGLMAA